MKLEIAGDSKVPIYIQLEEQIQTMIAAGQLHPGDQLPTIRELAADLRVNYNTVARAYSEMEIRGIVNTQQGTGTFISDKKIELTEVERERILSEISRSIITKANSYGFTIEEIVSYLQDKRRD